MPAPEVTVPPLPPVATTQDAAGAEAFVRHWFDLLNYGYRSGDTSPLTSASDEVCVECEAFAQRISEFTSTGESIAGTAFTIGAVQAGVPDATGRAPVDVAFRQAEIVVVEMDGTEATYDPEPVVNAVAVVEWRQNSWFMIGLANA